MTATIKITLASGKSIELTREELDEIVRNFGQHGLNQRVNAPYVPIPSNQKPWPNQWDIWCSVRPDFSGKY
jgi:hypothetical protein